jgi:hypothetical protein
MPGIREDVFSTGLGVPLSNLFVFAEGLVAGNVRDYLAHLGEVITCAQSDLGLYR